MRVLPDKTVFFNEVWPLETLGVVCGLAAKDLLCNASSSFVIKTVKSWWPTVYTESEQYKLGGFTVPIVD